MRIAIDPSGNLSQPNFNQGITGALLTNTFIPDSWAAIKSALGPKYTGGDSPSPTDKQSVLSIQANGDVQNRNQGANGSFETWNLTGNVMSIRPNDSGNFGATQTVVAWAYVIIG